jgi:hypothetical protein
MPWKWLAVLFLLCSLQGWLLSITSISMFLVFGAIIGIVAHAIAQNPNLAKHYTDYTYFRQYPIAATAEVKAVSLLWAGLLGWNLAEVFDNLWHEAINWQVAIALSISCLIATAIVWLWVTMAAVVGHKLAEQITKQNQANPKLSAVKPPFWILASSSWMGMAIGNLFS